jgi:hypothetical protein
VAEGADLDTGLQGVRIVTFDTGVKRADVLEAPGVFLALILVEPVGLAAEERRAGGEVVDVDEA